MAQLDGYMLSPEEAIAWWFAKGSTVVLDDKRFVQEAPRLGGMLIQHQCRVFLADEGKSWMLVSPAKESLFIDFMFSSLPGAVVRLAPLLLKVLLDGGYERMSLRACSKPQERLFRRFFGEPVGDAFEVNVGQIRSLSSEQT